MNDAFPQESPHPLAHVRRSRGWSYQDLARVVAENARALGVPMAARREKIWRWEHWGVVPEPDSQRALARALGVPPRELRDRPWPHWLPVPGSVPSGLPWTAAGSVAALRTLLADGWAAEDTREQPLVTGQALREAIADWAAAAPVARQVNGHLADAVADGATVAWLEAGVLGLRRLDDRLGGAAVRHRVEADLRIVADLLHRGARDRSVDGRLFAVAADLAQLGGWAAADTGRPAAAQRLFLTGLRVAHAARDRSLAANLLAGLSLEAVLSGRPRDALAAADAAASAAGGAAGRLRAMVETRRARALALLNDEPGCRRALERAEALLGSAHTDPGPPWLYWFDAAELAAQSGLALLELGLAHQARGLLERALRVQDRSLTRDRGLYLARAGLACVRVGDVEGAAAHAAEAGRLVARCPSSPRVTAALSALEGELATSVRGVARPVAGAALDRVRAGSLEPGLTTPVGRPLILNRAKPDNPPQAR
ncbi:hypothetical protein AQ490_24155 [Wenjunlia vitaminophila]|uniref:Transcriptional regulator n=1 Tax=Wenjunlia vitaminophila TaxID=76728 RepID=A0A0T6LR87_WENVI|nr:helix-turn-helix transcriptional regulator [Wenjunlia vitaminophila]KRV48634.1 hypothetical protein AQ490_24155 [Wenjunlia vitaminophila]